jgi:hypothetical protein
VMSCSIYKSLSVFKVPTILNCCWAIIPHECIIRIVVRASHGLLNMFMFEIYSF